MTKLTKASTTGLIEGYDFEIVSLAIINEDFEYHTFNSFFNENINDYYNDFKGENYIEQLIALKKDKFNGCQSYGKTPMMNSPKHFFSTGTIEIDIDLATNLGLGVVMLKNNQLKGKKLIYSINGQDDSNEKLRLAMYLQLVDKNSNILALKKVLEKDRSYLEPLIHRDADEVISKLKNTFKIKEKNNVVPFKRK